MENYKTIEYRGYNINIKYDDDPQSPREWGHISTIYSNSRTYNPDNRSIDEIYYQECYQDEDGIFESSKFSEDYIWLPVYAYIHSGITISCHRTGQYEDKFDSGLLGIIAVEKSVAAREYGYNQIGEHARKIIEGYLEEEIKVLNAYYTGEVYGYTITKMDDEGNEEQHYSCWGFYGEDALKSIENECKEYIDNI